MDDMMKERICTCALNRIFGYEPRYALELMRTLGSATSVFGLGEKETGQLLGPGSKYHGKINPRALDEAEKELEGLRGKGLGFIGIGEPGYPEALKECEDPPVGLYCRSASPPGQLFGDRPAVAIVGTRDISPYGREMCPRIVSAIARSLSLPVIVSGMAFGVDISAHLSALECGLSTIGVLPCGIDMVYPARHAAAAARIASSPGSGLVTDYPPGTMPQAFTFLRRNRIIAGLCSATILVESKAKGGGLITCRLAHGYGREVFALPGRIDDLRSAGCNALIQEKIAEAISSLDGLPRQLGLSRCGMRSGDASEEWLRRRYEGRPDKEKLLMTVSLIRKNRGITLDGLCERTGADYGEVSAAALTLQADGIIDIDLLQRCTINTKNL